MQLQAAARPVAAFSLHSSQFRKHNRNQAQNSLSLPRRIFHRKTISAHSFAGPCMKILPHGIPAIGRRKIQGPLRTEIPGRPGNHRRTRNIFKDHTLPPIVLSAISHRTSPILPVVHAVRFLHLVTGRKIQNQRRFRTPTIFRWTPYRPSIVRALSRLRLHMQRNLRAFPLANHDSLPRHALRGLDGSRRYIDANERLAYLYHPVQRKLRFGFLRLARNRKHRHE